MNCLLVSATAEEIAPFLNHFSTSEKTLYIDFNLHVLITGVGIMASTYHLTNYLAKNRPHLIIMVGIAGCFSKKIALGDAVVVRNETVADMGVWEDNNWKDMFDLKLIKANTIPYKNKKLTNPNVELLKKTGLKVVDGITVNEVTTGKKNIENKLQKYASTIESMEGASLHFIALQHQIAFLQIRGISNYIGERNKKNWKIKEAINSSNQVLINLLETI
jgi:futalosine hydrolase